MDSETKSPTISQPAELKSRKSGRTRVTARQLSPILRQLIVDRFHACHSTEDIAEELRVPARTVTDVVIAWLISNRSPQPERRTSFGLVRRAA